MLFALLFSILFGSMHCFPDAKAVAEKSTGPTVVTPLGNIQGTIMKTILGKTIYAFRGIPYAKPPVGELRFKPPEPVDKWNTTLDASKDGFACPQPTTYPVSDDCLVLNVYSTLLPKGDKNPKRPVIIYFHAGGFYAFSGQSIWMGPQYFMEREIVLVTPNYRLASLGFLSTGDKEAPGNNGLKDQVMVLKWVKQNIEAFGGDPDLVTIAGYSAGGVSVTLHMVSPMSRGLFHRAISMSGSVVGNWKIPTHQLHLAKKQARLVGCPETNSTEIINCLKTKSADEIGQTFNGFNEWGIHPLLKWMPVIEPDFGQERFLTEDPNDLFQKGKTAQVPFMAGVNTYEFSGMAYDIVANETLLKDINNDFERVAPILFYYERDTERSKHITKELKKFYLDDKPIDNTTVAGLAEIFADTLGFNIYRAVNIVSSTNNHPVYYYKFAYKGRYSHYYLPNTNNTVTLGPVHHDEGIYLFYGPKLFPMFKEPDPEAKIVDRMTSMWANFARTGNPTPEAPELWKPYTTDNKKYLNIDNDLSMEDGLFAKRYELWDKLFPVKVHLHHKHDSAHAKFTG